MVIYYMQQDGKMRELRLSWVLMFFQKENCVIVLIDVTKNMSRIGKQPDWDLLKKMKPKIWER